MKPFPALRYNHFCNFVNTDLYIGNPPEEDWKVEEEVEPAGWTSWSPSSDCIGNCETGGVINWTRSCTNPPPSSSSVEADPRALYCEGEAEESRLCEPPGCNSE